jgi:hypothetical protein
MIGTRLRLPKKWEDDLLPKVFGLLACLMPAPSFACGLFAEMVLSDVFLADAVLVGQVVDYEVVKIGDESSQLNYGRFNVKIEKVVAGDVLNNLNTDGSLTFTLVDSAFGAPADFQRNVPYFFALRDPSGVTMPTLESDRFTVLQAPCSKAFIFKDSSPQSQILQQVLETDRDPERELEILEEFAFERGAFMPLQIEVRTLEYEMGQLRAAMNEGQ